MKKILFFVVVFWCFVTVLSLPPRVLAASGPPLCPTNYDDITNTTCCPHNLTLPFTPGGPTCQDPNAIIPKNCTRYGSTSTYDSATGNCVDQNPQNLTSCDLSKVNTSVDKKLPQSVNGPCTIFALQNCVCPENTTLCNNSIGPFPGWGCYVNGQTSADPICPFGTTAMSATSGGGCCNNKDYQYFNSNVQTCSSKTVSPSACNFDPNYSMQFNTATNKCDYVAKSKIWLCFEKTCTTALGEIPTDPAGLVNFFLKLALMLAGVSIILVLIAIGYRVLTSGGNPEKLQSAKELATSLLGGILLILLSMVILRAIGVDILGIPGFQYDTGGTIPQNGTNNRDSRINFGTTVPPIKSGSPQ